MDYVDPGDFRSSSHSNYPKLAIKKRSFVDESFSDTSPVAMVKKNTGNYNYMSYNYN